MRSAPIQPRAVAHPSLAARRGVAVGGLGIVLGAAQALVSRLLSIGSALPIGCALLVGCGFLAGCKGGPPIEASSGLRSAPGLRSLAPSDIAVLAVEDGTTERGFGGLDPVFRRALSEVLVQRGYSPLAPSHVDQLLQQSGAVDTGSAVGPTFLSSVRGSFAADAVLGLRVTEWDVRDVALSSPRVGFRVEVLMLGAESGERLWWGTFEGKLKPGGERTAPLGRQERIRAAADTLARTLGAELEMRSLAPRAERP